MQITMSLWLPILVASVVIFIASSLIHMVFKWHNSDYLKLPNEDAVSAAIRAGSLAPGQYALPHCVDMKEMGGEVMQKKFADGPVALITLLAIKMTTLDTNIGSHKLIVICILFSFYFEI